MVAAGRGRDHGRGGRGDHDGGGDGRLRVQRDGQGAAFASLCNPRQVIVLPGGDLLIADASLHRVRKVEAASGVIRTLVGRPGRLLRRRGGPPGRPPHRHRPRRRFTSNDAQVQVNPTQLVISGWRRSGTRCRRRTGSPSTCRRRGWATCGPRPPGGRAEQRHPGVGRSSRGTARTPRWDRGQHERLLEGDAGGEGGRAARRSRRRSRRPRRRWSDRGNERGGDGGARRLWG